jgi:hypothetical protein
MVQSVAFEAAARGDRKGVVEAASKGMVKTLCGTIHGYCGWVMPADVH